MFGMMPDHTGDAALQNSLRGLVVGDLDLKKSGAITTDRPWL